MNKLSFERRAVLGVLLTVALPGPAHAQPPQDEDALVVSLHDRASRSVVVVRCGGVRWGTAFALDARRLATARHVAQCPRRIDVETLDARVVLARVVAMDGEHDLAILEPTEGLALEPIPLREDAPRVGLRVAAVGFPAEGERAQLTWTSGTIGQVTDDLVVSSVPATPGSSGGPLLDAQGRLTGVVVEGLERSGLTRAVRASHLAALARAHPGSEGEVRSPLRLGFGLGGGVLFDPHDALGGFTFGASAALNDEWTLRLSAGVFFNDQTSWTPEPRHRSRSYVFGALELGYRLRFELGEGFALTLEPTIGLAVGLDTVSQTQLLIGVADPSCDPRTSQCAIATTAVGSQLETWRVRPTLGLRLGIADALSLGYQLQLDVERPEDSTHQITLGVHF